MILLPHQLHQLDYANKIIGLYSAEGQIKFL
jgi:hypothetical protein